MTYVTMKVEVSVLVPLPNGKTLCNDIARDLAKAATTKVKQALDQHTVEQVYVSVFAKGTREYLYRS
jgi:hypothetical protein